MTAMGLKFTLKESSALYRLLADNTTDIILKTDRDGFIVHASPAIERLGLALPNMLIGPHLLDLVHPSRAAAVKAEHEAAIRGRQDGRWIEFPALTEDHRQRWFEIQLRCLMDDHDEIYGALGIMRSIEERRTFEEKLFAAEMTDALTGLTNRKAFIAMLQHLVDNRVGGCLAMFDIDHFRAINMQHGQSFGDEVLVVFSDLLRTSMRQDDIISRIGGESLGVLLPGTGSAQAEAICRRVITTLSEIREALGPDAFSITASAGIAPIGGSLDNTIKRTELALFLAKAKGRNRLELDEGVQFSGAAGPSLS
jgi:diguanylate cyclase (GGDEF)-like protein/PAS domain S-box-containing protein